jgi:TolB-like protein
MKQLNARLSAIVILMILFLLHSQSLAYPQQQNSLPKERPRFVVIATATPETEWTKTMMAAALEDALSENGWFDLITATQREKILREQGFSSSDLVDPKQATEVGRLLSARYIIIGNVVDVSVNRIFADTVNVRVQIQLVEVKTGLVKLSKSFDETLTKFGKTEVIHRREAFQSVMKKVAPIFVREIERTIPIEGLIVKIFKNRFYLDVGSDHGVQAGQIFDIYTQEEPIKNVAGELLSYVKVIHGRLRVADVESNVSWGVVTETFKEDGVRDRKPDLNRIKVGYAIKKSGTLIR